MDTDRILAETFITRVEYHRSLPSTNDRAAELADCDPTGLPLLVVADEQTAGRGRGANRWWAGPGSLACSLLLEADRNESSRPSRSPLIALATGVAVVEAVAPRLPSTRLGIAWPNDVMADGAKLAGILVEVLASGRQVVGIGLNVDNTAADAPGELRDRLATMRDLAGHRHGVAEVLLAMLGQLHTWLAHCRDEPESVTRRANELCTQRGTVLTIEQGSRRTTGRCLGIATDGALRLETERGIVDVYSGIVHGGRGRACGT